MASGGPRIPTNPAPVSGPGPLSARTDGGPGQPNMKLDEAAYGEQKAFQEIQSGAPMAEDPMASPGGMPAPPGLREPTQRPNEPLTQGVPSGPGANQLQGLNNVMNEDMKVLAKYLPAMRSMSTRPGVPRSFQLFTKYLESFKDG